MALIYKKTENGNIAVDGKGLPVVVDDETNNEFGIDAVHLYGKIPSLQEEAKNHRLEAAAAKESLAKFEGIEDPKAALKAIQTVMTLGDVDLKKKEEVDRLLKSTEDAWKTKFDGLNQQHAMTLSQKEKANALLESEVFNALVSSQFSKSPFFAGPEPTTTLIPDIAEAYFGKHFKAEIGQDGKRAVVGYLGEHPIYSKTRPGEYADFNECIHEIISAYPMKDKILVSSEGSGGKGGRGGLVPGINRGDNEAFITNVDKIAKGTVVVKR